MWKIEIRIGDPDSRLIKRKMYHSLEQFERWRDKHTKRYDRLGYYNVFSYELRNNNWNLLKPKQR
jgi:hypothetical protein